MYAIGRNESWLSDMASKGLHLKKLGRIYIYFEKGESKETNYRIDIIKEKPSQEQLDVYHDCGWDVVTNNGSFYIFSTDKKLCNIELHTDPIEQGFSLFDLNKRLKNNVIIMSILIFLLIGMIYSTYFLNTIPYLFMITGSFDLLILVVICELYVFYLGIRNYVAIRNLKKCLLQGKAINHKENFTKARLSGGILAGLFLPLAVFSMIIPVIQIAKSNEYTLPDMNTNLPIIMLADIEQNLNLMREQSYNNNDIDRLNRVRYDWSILAPVQYEINEHGIIDGEVWDDNSGKYKPSLTTRYYKVTFGCMSDNLTQDLINFYVFRDNTKIIEINNSKLDKMYLTQEGMMKQIFAYLGNQVIYVTYYGTGEIEDIIPLVEEMLLAY